MTRFCHSSFAFDYVVPLCDQGEQAETVRGKLSQHCYIWEPHNILLRENGLESSLLIHIVSNYYSLNLSIIDDFKSTFDCLEVSALD